jgi:hypothetical protein
MNSLLVSTTEQLAHTGIIDHAAMQQLRQQSSPWWLHLLLGGAAWVASILIISAFIGPILALADNITVHLTVGLLLLVGAIWLVTRIQEFLQHMSVAVALAGQGLLAYAVYSWLGYGDEAPRYACAVISGLLLFSPLNQLHQRVSLSIALLCLLSLISSAPLIAVVSNLLAAVAVFLWCSRVQWAGLAYAATLKSLLEIMTLAGLILTLLGQCLLIVDSSNWLNDKLMLAQALYSALGSVLLLSTVFWLSRAVAVTQRILLLTSTVILCVLLYPASGLLVSSALLLACFYGCSTRWYALCLLSMLFAVGQFYYSLQLNLLHKSALLAVSGMVLLAAWYVLQRYQRRVI